MARNAVVALSVIDLRKEPCSIVAQDFSHQDLRETQLLYGERCIVLEERGEWVKIGALEQLCFNELSGWHPYQGWVLQNEITLVTSFEPSCCVIVAPTLQFEGIHLSFGTYLSAQQKCDQMRQIPQKPNRMQLVEDAQKFIGLPYLWGGRAFCMDSTISSVDCSGLTNLLYRAQGISLPRNAHEQHLKSTLLHFTALQPGDLLFLAKEKSVSHVLMKLEDHLFLEAPQTGQHVRCLKWGEEIWEDRGKIHIFDRPHSYFPYGGTFIVV